MKRVSPVGVLDASAVPPCSFMMALTMASMIVSGWRHALAARALADLVITPEIRTPSQLGLASRAWVTEAGERAASAQLVELRELFERA